MLIPGTILGEYEIRASLGAGGMGEVYRARDSRLNREVAIKVLPVSFARDTDRLRRFEQEARSVAALNHSNILVVYQMGTHEGTPYLVSELLEGESLRERMRRGPMPLRLVVDYGVQIARGLAAAHEKGIVHRDLKPENLFLTKDGHVKILDFGLAKMVQRAGVEASEQTFMLQTEPGMLIGTVGYMSPEQVRGHPADQRSDIFSLCVILQEMLTGVQTFKKSTSAETMTAILNEDPGTMPQLGQVAPPALQRVLQHGLEKSPEQRFQSASDLGFALEAMLSTELSAPALRLQMPAVTKSGRYQTLLAVAVLVVLLGVVLAYVWMRSEPMPTVANYVQVTHDGLQKSLIGTDGSRLYMNLVSTGGQDVAAIHIAGGQQRAIPLPGVGMAAVGLSPDGTDLLVVEGSGVPPKGPLWSVPVFGGSPRRLGDAVGDEAAWSPDGKMLAYADNGDLYLADEGGSEAHRIVSMPNYVSNLAWSPNGESLRFVTSEGYMPEVGPHLAWEVAVRGGTPRRLLPGWQEPPDQCCGRWTADGRSFVFQSLDQIWALPEERGLLHAKAVPVQLTSSPMALQSPLPSKDGKKLFVVGRTYRGELTRYDAGSRKFVPYLDGISAEYLDFSNDGEWVAYVTYPEGTLWRSRLDGSERLQLTYPPLGVVGPRWSGDGKTIVFFEFPGKSDQPARMLEVSTEGGSAHELLPNDAHNQQDPAWSPDGSRILFAGDPHDAEVGKTLPGIRVLDVQTREVSGLPGSEGLFSPRWSRDGRYVAALTGASSTLMVMDMKTQRWSAVAKGTFGWPNWSRDSRHVYLLDFKGKGTVLRVGVEDHKVEKMVDLKELVTTGRFGGSLSLAPDDSPLLLRDRGTQDVYALDWQQP